MPGRLRVLTAGQGVDRLPTNGPFGFRQGALHQRPGGLGTINGLKEPDQQLANRRLVVLAEDLGEGGNHRGVTQVEELLLGGGALLVISREKRPTQDPELTGPRLVLLLVHLVGMDTVQLIGGNPAPLVLDQTLRSAKFVVGQPDAIVLDVPQLLVCRPEELVQLDRPLKMTLGQPGHLIGLAPEAKSVLSLGRVGDRLPASIVLVEDVLLLDYS